MKVCHGETRPTMTAAHYNEALNPTTVDEWKPITVEAAMTKQDPLQRSFKSHSDGWMKAHHGGVRPTTIEQDPLRRNPKSHYNGWMKACHGRSHYGETRFAMVEATTVEEDPLWWNKTHYDGTRLAKMEQDQLWRHKTYYSRRTRPTTTEARHGRVQNLLRWINKTLET